MIRLTDITKEFRMGGEVVRALQGLTLHIRPGEFVAIMGPSGSGKSTAMNILGCLDRPTSGHYTLAGEDVSRLSGDALAEVRNRRIGFVFQSFNLISSSSAADNVALPLMYSGAKNARARAIRALERVGLAERAGHRPNELSGGQRQRVAIARALVTAPKVILADEPTGNLDTKTSLEILALFEELHREGSTIVMVTHEPDVAEHTERILTIRDGVLSSDAPTGKRRKSASMPAIGQKTAGLETTGQKTAGQMTAGLETAGLETAGLETAGLETTGLETAGGPPAGETPREKAGEGSP